MKNTILSGKTLNDIRIEKGEETMSKIGDDGLDGYERNFKNGAGKNSSPLCVGHTVMDLSEAGFQVILNLGAVKGLGLEYGREKFIEMLKEKYNILVVDSYKNIESI